MTEKSEDEVAAFTEVSSLKPTRNNGESCSNCNIWSKLPDDLLVEVLCWLPEKPLIRFKQVCKLWNNLIDNACVPRVYRSSPLCGFLYHTKWLGQASVIGYAAYKPLPLGDSPGFVQSFSALLQFEPTTDNLLDCCNGLFLFIRISVPQYYVCNPMIKQCVAIPRNLMYGSPKNANLAFNPSKSPHYKIIRLDRSPSNTVMLSIFSSENGKWAAYKLQVECFVLQHTLTRRAVYLDGFLYCLSFSKCILCIDLDKINAHAINLPKTHKNDELGYMGSSRGRLYYSDCFDSRLLVWLFEDCQKTDRWILVHSICINELARDPLGRILCAYWRTPSFKTYALHPTSEVIFIGCYHLIVSYDPTSKRLGLVCVLSRQKMILLGPFLVYPYTRCLMNLKDFELKLPQGRVLASVGADVET